MRKWTEPAAALLVGLLVLIWAGAKVHSYTRPGTMPGCRMQRFGTQYEAAAEPGTFRLAPTDPQVTDELRVAVGAPPLTEAKATEGRFDKE